MIVMQIHFFGVCGQLLSMTLSRSFHIAKWRWLPCFLLLFDGWPRWMSQIKCCGHSWSRLRANTWHRQFLHWTTFSAFQIKSLVRHACSTIFDVQLPCDDHSYILIAGLCVDSSIWFSSAHTTNETLDHNGVTAIWMCVIVFAVCCDLDCVCPHLCSQQQFNKSLFACALRESMAMCVLLLQCNETTPGLRPAQNQPHTFPLPLSLATLSLSASMMRRLSSPISCNCIQSHWHESQSMSPHFCAIINTHKA